ncbi:MAG: FAD-dependent oxidoreductase, partial [Bacteroidota bacterium]
HSKYDSDVIRKIVASRSAALNQIDDWVNEYNLNCDFKRQPWTLYSGIKENDQLIEQEHKYANEAGVHADWITSPNFPLTVSKALEVKNQAQINPMRYVQELANAVGTENLSIFENTQVLDVEEKKDSVILTTSGGTVKAKFAVHATHTPKGIKAVQTVLGPYREYGIACRINNTSFPEGIFWGYHDEGKKFSWRLYERNGQRFVLVVGEPHKVGQSDDNIKAVQNLEAFAQKHFGLNETAFRWGGQHYRPADLLPYIGRESKTSKVFFATGYSTDGLVYGTLAGMLIADEITGQENEWTQLFKAHRFTPIKSAKKFLKENINIAGEFLKDLPGVKDTSEFKDVQPGSGAIVEKDQNKIAAYRSEAGELSLVSAVCPHMKCIVSWNNAEKTWDCPCHGSRFKPDGTILEGPAYHSLHKISVEGNNVKKEGH